MQVICRKGESCCRTVDIMPLNGYMLAVTHLMADHPGPVDTIQHL